MNFCRRCGAEFESFDSHMHKCLNGHTIYDNASPATAVILENSHGEIVLIERGVAPGKGAYDLPGGFCDGAEPLEAAIQREIEEEIGLTADQYSKLVFVNSGTDYYDFAGETMTVLSCIFYAQVHDDNVRLKADDDAESAQFIFADAALADQLYFPGLQAGVHEFLRNAEAIRQMSKSTV